MLSFSFYLICYIYNNPHSTSTSGSQKKRISMYKILQLFNNSWNSILKQWTLGFFITGTVISITASYTLFRIHNNPLISTVLILITLLLAFNCVTNEIIRHACTLCQLSGLSHSSSFKTKNELYRLCWNSCRPFSVWVGDIFCLETKEFALKLFGSVILETVINILLAFP